MSNTKPHGPWPKFDDIFPFGKRTRRDDASAGASETEETPWLAMSGQTNLAQSGSASMESPYRVAKETRSHYAGQGPKWLNDDESLYGIAEDHSTVKQADSSTWRRMFGSKRGKRFVAASTTSRWQASSGVSGKAASGKPIGTGATWLLQTLCAAALVGAGWYASRTDSALAAKIDGLYGAAFRTDYSQVTWPAVSQFLAKHHIALPALSQSAGALHLHAPLNGTVTADYSSTHPEMFVTGRSGENVLAAGSGTVTQVVGDGTDPVVKIDHGSLGASVYIGMQKVYVKKGDIVSSGQPIGRLPDTSQPVLRFAVERNGLYINPHDYIQFTPNGV